MSVSSRLPRAAFVLAIVVTLLTSSIAFADGGREGLGNVKRIFVIMLENHSQSTVIGDANAPFITSLAHTYAEATNYYGVTHPSQPNYVAAITGQLDITRMNDAATNHYDWTNLVDQLESHGRTWGAYMDTLPVRGLHRRDLSRCAAFPPSGAALYTNKHNPFVLMDDVLASPARLANIKPYTSLAADLNCRMRRISCGSARTSATTCMAACTSRLPAIPRRRARTAAPSTTRTTRR